MPDIQIKTSRAQIADLVGDAFGRSALTRDDLVAAARHSTAPAGVVEALASLPEGKRFATLRDLWPSLPHLPIEA